MTPEDLLELSAMPHFPGTARELVSFIGLDATASLISAWPGQVFPVPMRSDKNPRGIQRFSQLAEIIGEPAAQLIVANWGGEKLCIPNCKMAIRAQKHQRIRADYDKLTLKEGFSHSEAIFEIGITHGESGRCVEMVLKRAA